MDSAIETLRDTSVMLWWLMIVLPMLGATSLAQLWKRDYQYRDPYGRKPPNHITRLVSSLIGTVLATLAHGLTGTAGWPHALGIGLLIGAATPLVWWLAAGVAPEKLARAMRGERDVWSEEHRRHVQDSLYGDDPTLRDEIRRRRAQHDQGERDG